MPEFTHLHLHTEYSLLDGMCALDRGKKHVSPLMECVKAQGQSAVAITDHGNVYGWVHFYKAAKAHGLKPILGCEVYVTPGNHLEKTLVNGRQANHLVLLAENETGYDNLMHLVSEAHLHGMYYKPRIDRPLLAQHAKGLIALSACLKGEVAEALVEDRDEAKAERLAAEYAEIMGKGNFFLEVQDHGLAPQAPLNRQLVALARKLDLPLVATNDVHYLKREHEKAHEMLLCLQTQDKWSNPTRMKYGSDQFYLKSAAEMAAVFGDLPEALENTMAIAERCNVEMKLGGQKNPHFPTYQCPNGMHHKEYLTMLGKEGLKRRYGVEDVDNPKTDLEKRVSERFWHEMAIIEKTGFLNYFLVVWDFINAAKEMGVPVGPGRGSGAGSIVAYAIGITGIDPLKYNLIFERFLNPERVSPPDFDVDFCQTRRGEVIEYVKRKYGHDSVAQIITYGTLGAKTLFRDIGRAMEFPLVECDKLAKLIPATPGTTLTSALNDSKEFADACKNNECAREIMKYAPLLEDMPRQTGIHAAGVVIGEKPLVDIIPLSLDKEGHVISQWESVPLEEAGLLKMDFLGLQTLTIIREACENVKATDGVDIDIDHLPLDDEATYKMLASGQTVAVFQVESDGMRELLKRLEINKIEELNAMIALYRPGPMDMIPDFIDRKLGRQKITYPHPKLEPILQDTYGIFLYQEQIQQTVGALAGFSMGQGDVLRRAMGKKKADVMARERENFVQGCKKMGTCDRAKAEEIFSTMEKFASYGFNKSHAAAYGLVTYQTAWLKTHYPVQYMAAILSSAMGNTDKLPVFVAEAKRMGIPILPPDVNESGLRFTPVKGSIRYGLAGIKGVGEGAVEALIKERKANGPFKGLVDFCERVGGGDVNRKTIESLIKCGAFDFSGLSRRRLFGGLDDAMSYASTRQKDRQKGQSSLFDMLGGDAAAGSGLALTDADLPPESAGGDAWTQRQLLEFEKELTGFYISGHPLESYVWTQKTFDLTVPTQVNELEERTRTRLSGLVDAPQKRIIKPKKEGDLPKPMISFRLEALDGTAVSAVAFSETCEKYGDLLTAGAAVMLCGSIRADKNGGKSFSISEVYPLSEVPTLFSRHVTLHVRVGNWRAERVKEVQELLQANRGPVPVQICLHYEDKTKVYVQCGDKWSVKPGEKMIAKLKELVDTVRVAVKPNALLQEPETRPWRRRREE